MNLGEARAAMKLRLVPADPVPLQSTAAATQGSIIQAPAAAAPAVATPVAAAPPGEVPDGSWCEYAGDLAADVASLVIIADAVKPTPEVPQGYTCDNVEDRHLEKFSSGTARALRRRFGDAAIPWWAEIGFAVGNMWTTVRRSREPKPPKTGQPVNGALVPDVAPAAAARPASTPEKKPPAAADFGSLFPPPREMP